jgi:nucleoside-diphosphate-sugar epimerase
MRVLVAGATGAIGRPLVPLLSTAGHEVIGLTRSAEKAEALRLTGAEAVVADALDAAAVERAVADAAPDVVVHQLTALPDDYEPRALAKAYPRTSRLRREVDDAAAATVAAVEGGATGVYNVVDDDPAPMREWLPLYAEALGAPRPLRVPAVLARLVAGRATVEMATVLRGASNAKARTELGWTPRWASWRTGFREGLENQDHAGAPRS